MDNLPIAHQLNSPINNSTINIELAEKFAQLALNCIFCEYPHSQTYFAKSDQDIQLHRQLNPAFYGCLDWHSAVHAHWLLARISRLFPNTDFSTQAQRVIATNITAVNIAQEVKYLQAQPTFERPYGFAWLLQLATELQEWQDPLALECLDILKPLIQTITENISNWLTELTIANRTGTHKQTAFAFGLYLDWANISGDQVFADLIKAKALEFYENDQNYPWHIEPTDYDFLSPTLAEADLMRRILAPTKFATWLTKFLPHIPNSDQKLDWFVPAKVNNPADYQQSHLDGLNISRAWMLEGIIHGLPVNDPRIPTLTKIAKLHTNLGIQAVIDQHYAGSHWLGSFAVYLLTQRGIT
jgi:hypothetical protein